MTLKGPSTFNEANMGARNDQFAQASFHSIKDVQTRQLPVTRQLANLLDFRRWHFRIHLILSFISVISNSFIVISESFFMFPIVT
jgi:hypothetical protein